MASMESFYGGRQGASFVIVKQFDGVDIPDNTYYRYRWFAKDPQGFFYVPLIERTDNNYKTYADFGKIPCDGVTTVESAEGVVSEPLPLEYQQGMKQCFAKGGDSTNIVNYGEYVIIDTIAGRAEFHNPDNGKVYRRGMNYDYNAITNPLCGAEFVGQIIGPKGDCPELNFDHYDSIVSSFVANEREYTEADDDLVPGSYIDEITGERKFNDSLRYAYVTIKDEDDVVKGCLIGFKLPTIVEEFVARSITPYENRHVDEHGEYYYDDLVVPDADQYVDDKWVHPFYQKWHIKIPQGYHGIDSDHLEVIPSKTMPTGFKSEDYAGTAVYTDEDCLIPLEEGGVPVVLTTPHEILRDEYYSTDPAIICAMIEYDDDIYYVKKEDCYMDIIRYRETDYENVAQGEVTYHEIGYYNEIQRITVSETGVLTAFYSAVEEPQALEQVIRWIDKDNTEGITVDSEGTLTVHYNTVHEDPETGEIVHDTDVYPKLIDWITSVSLSQDGDFDILFNNDSVAGGHYSTVLNWVDYITLDEDGTIKFFYNSDHNDPAFTFSKYIQKIEDVSIQTTAPGSDVEGTGDQKIRITYNTTDSEGEPIVEAIGNPLNYIIEITVSTRNALFPDVPYCHLLVYYSDPALRQTLADKWVTYPSEKYPGEVWTQWVDLGLVRGEPGGVHILKDVASMDELKDIYGNYLPPERLEDRGGQVINPDAAGWAVSLTPSGSETTTLLFYDYEVNEWYPAGSIGQGAIDPTYVIVKGAPIVGQQQPDPAVVENLNNYGFWLAAEEGYYAY